MIRRQAECFLVLIAFSGRSACRAYDLRFFKVAVGRPNSADGFFLRKAVDLPGLFFISEGG